MLTMGQKHLLVIKGFNELLAASYAIRRHGGDKMDKKIYEALKPIYELQEEYCKTHNICGRCSEPKTNEDCIGVDECIDHNKACFGWHGMCCQCGHDYAMGQM